MGNDKIVFYQNPIAERPRDSSSKGKRPSPPELASSAQKWTRFKQYKPKGKAPEQAASSSTASSRASDAPRRDSSARQRQPARSQRPGAEPSQHLMVLPQLPQLLSPADPDPFAALPSQTDPYAARMLQLYVDKDLLTALFSRSIPLVPKLWLEQRKQKWLPLAMTSPAAYNALILYMETAPGMPASPELSLQHRRRLTMTLSTLNRDLCDPDKATSDATVLAVVFLMHVSEHMDDFDAFRSHAFGLETIVAHRRALPPGVLPRSRPDVSHVEGNISNIARRNILRPELVAHLRYWHALAMSFRIIARDDWVMVLASQHMMTTGFPFGGDLLPIEEAYAEALKLNAARMFPNKVVSLSSGFALHNCIDTVRRRLEQIDMDWYMNACPDLMIWTAVVVGPVSAGHGHAATDFFAALLRTAVRAMGNCSYEEAQLAVRAQLILPVPFDDLSRQFWNHVIGMREKIYEVPDYLDPTEPDEPDEPPPDAPESSRHAAARQTEQ